VFSAQIFQENTFLKTKLNFLLTGKCFPLTNFSNDKQTQESLESGFPETTSRKTNTSKRENIFLEIKPNFSLTGKCFPLTNFPNGKQTQESLESGFPKSKFRETNMALTNEFLLLLQGGHDLFDENRMPKPRFPDHWRGKKNGIYSGLGLADAWNSISLDSDKVNLL
jgi:hypothetical protein